MAGKILDIPTGRNKWQVNMLHAKIPADHVDPGLGLGKDQAAGRMFDAHEGVFVGLLASLMVAELPALVDGAAAPLLLVEAHGAVVVVARVFAGEVHIDAYVIGIAVVFIEVVAAGVHREVTGGGAAVAHGACESVGEGSRDKEEKGHGLNDRAEVNHDEP